MNDLIIFIFYELCDLATRQTWLGLNKSQIHYCDDLTQKDEPASHARRHLHGALDWHQAKPAMVSWSDSDIWCYDCVCTDVLCWFQAASGTLVKQPPPPSSFRSTALQGPKGIGGLHRAWVSPPRPMGGDQEPAPLAQLTTVDQQEQTSAQRSHEMRLKSFLRPPPERPATYPAINHRWQGLFDVAAESFWTSDLIDVDNGVQVIEWCLIIHHYGVHALGYCMNIERFTNFCILWM